MVWIMDIGAPDIILLYLFENQSFESSTGDEVSSVLTKEAVALKCGINRNELDRQLTDLKKLVIIRKKRIKRRKTSSECVFLNSKGVVKAKEIMTSVNEKRVDFLDERGERKNMKISEVRSELENFDRRISVFDLFMISRRGMNISLSEFLVPHDWKDSLFSDHAFPEMILITNTSCIPFGGIFTTFGENGIILPVNKKVEVGIHKYGSGDVIRWMKRYGNSIIDAFYISGKRGFETLVSNHSKVKESYSDYADRGVFKDENEFKEYFEVLKQYDYSIIFDRGTGHGISIAGHVGTVLASVAMYAKDGLGFPFNDPDYDPANSRMRSDVQIPVWDFPLPSEPMAIEDLIREKHPEDASFKEVRQNLRKFITLSQAFESHWNSFFPLQESENIARFKRTFGLKDYSSGSACLSSWLAAPVLISLEENGTVSLRSKVYPEMPRNQFIGLIIDRKGGIDNAREEFMETFARFLPLMSKEPQDALAYFKTLKSTSGSLSRLASKSILENPSFADPESVIERKAISALMTSQKGIYSTLGIKSVNFEEIQAALEGRSLEVTISPMGVGNSGTYFFCLHEAQNMHTLKLIIDQLNGKRLENQMIDMVLHGTSHSYIFNTDPLMVLKKDMEKKL